MAAGRGLWQGCTELTDRFDPTTPQPPPPTSNNSSNGSSNNNSGGSNNMGHDKKTGEVLEYTASEVMDLMACRVRPTAGEATHPASSSTP